MSTEHHHHHHHDHKHGHQDDHHHHDKPRMGNVTQDQLKVAREQYSKDGKRVLIGNITDAERETILQRIEHIKHHPQQKDDGDLITANDWGQIIGLVLSFTPYVGSFLKVGFGIVWGKIFSKDGQYITQDQFQIGLSALYKKIEKVLNEQLDATEINRCNGIFADCQNRGNNFNDLLTLFIERNQHKLGFIPNKNLDYRVEPPAHLAQIDDDNLLQMIRTEFQGYKDFLEGALINFSQPLYARLLGNLYAMTMMLYSNLMRDAYLQGIGWGLPPDYVYGNGSVKGLHQVLHDKTQDFHYYLARCNYDYELEIIKPAVSCIPALNLPDQGYILFSRINELDFLEYHDPVKRVDPDSNGNFQCADDSGSFKIFKFDPSKSSQNVSTDDHIDTVSGYNPTQIPITFGNPKYTIQRNGNFFPYISFTFAVFNYSLGNIYDLYINGTKVTEVSTSDLNDGCKRGPRMSYYYEERVVQFGSTSAQSTFVTVKLDLQDYFYSIDLELKGGNSPQLNSIEVTFPNYGGSDFIKVNVPNLVKKEDLKIIKKKF